MSKPITLAPSCDRRSTRVANLDLGQGQCPSVARLFSSISASTTAGEGGTCPRERKRRSYVFNSISSKIGGPEKKSMITRRRLKSVREVGLMENKNFRRLIGYAFPEGKC